MKISLENKRLKYLVWWLFIVVVVTIVIAAIVGGIHLVTCFITWSSIVPSASGLNFAVAIFRLGVVIGGIIATMIVCDKDFDRDFDI